MNRFIFIFVCTLFGHQLNAQYEKSGVGFEFGYGIFQGEFAKTAPGGLLIGIDFRQEIYPHVKLGFIYQSAVSSVKSSSLSSQNFSFRNGALKLWYHKNSIDDYYSSTGRDFNPFLAVSGGIGIIEEPLFDLVDGAKRTTAYAGMEIGTEYRHYTFAYRFNYYGNLPDEPKFYPLVAGKVAMSHNLILTLRFRTSYSVVDFVRQMF